VSTYHNPEEAYRLAAWLKEGAWHKMTLGDVESSGRLLKKLQDRLVEMEEEYAASMDHQNNAYNRRVAERDELQLQVNHWIEKHDALLAQQLETVPQEWNDKNVIAWCVARGIKCAT
jgi:molybdopterin converting factor small subunit